MMAESRVNRIDPKELPDLLKQLDREHVTDLALIGHYVSLSVSPEDWPEELQGRVLYQLTGRLSDVPRELLRLDRLQVLTLWSLRLKCNGARAIAEHLGKLTSLNLWHNEVGDAGAQAIAERLGKLTSLTLCGNKVGDAGARAIAEHLGKLTSLDLFHNEVGDAGARAIAEHLGKLTSLHLGYNQVGDTGARAIAEHLGKLTSLNLDNNDVGDEAVTAIGQQLAGLRSLLLENNKRITTVAPLVHVPLSTLNLAKTQVTDLTPMKTLVLAGLPVKWATNAGDGSGIYVEDCPLTHPSPDIVRQGPEAVVNYFREIEAQGIDRLFEAKLLIVGNPGAGKTSLLRRMFRPELDLPTEDQTTRGIDIHRHEFPLANGRNFRLNAWDFGGQQIYRATHQFFLTKRSLYLLVDDTRSNERSIHDEDFKFWLEIVETLSDHCPLLIFQNEKGGRSKSIDEAGHQGAVSPTSWERIVETSNMLTRRTKRTRFRR